MEGRLSRGVGLVALFIGGLAYSSCGGGSADLSPELQTATSAVPTDTATASSTPTAFIPKWSSRSVWNYDASVIDAACATPAFLVTDITCAVNGMTQSGANPSAAEFLRQTHYFLIQFDEAGSIDTGIAETPWTNMSRPEIVFLNGDPDVLFVNQLVPTTWQDDARYAALITQAHGLGDFLAVWPEYAHFTQAGDGQFVVSYPLQTCRACGVYALLRVALQFDSHGELVKQDILPPINQ